LKNILLALLLFNWACGEKSPTSAVYQESKRSALKPAVKGIDQAGLPQFSEEDRCPVCGMKILKHSKFASAIELKDGSAYYFCGTGCMIKSWLHPEIFIGQEKSQLKRALAPEYFRGRYIDALSARWVAGSDIIGPMGPALVPLKDEADLKVFQERHGGKHLFRLGELDDQRWASIIGERVKARPPQIK